MPTLIALDPDYVLWSACPIQVAGFRFPAVGCSS
jgi:hypothetical protein